MSRLRSAAPASGTLPASLILGSREQKQYRRFQAQDNSLRPQAYGTLPTAEQYAAFQSWCQKNDSGYFSDTPLSDLISSIHCEAQRTNQGKNTSATCGHGLHQTQWYEGARETVERCPVCIVEMHTTYMNILMQALKKAGGYMEQRWEAAPPSNPILEAFYAGKIAVIHAIAAIEQLVVMEEAYDQSNPNPNTEGGDNIKTAQEALRMYWTGIEGSTSDTSRSKPSPLSSPKFPSTSLREAPQEKQKKKSVSFAETTDFERGRDQHYFWRKSPRYEPGGKYDMGLSSSSASLSSEEDFEDDDSDSLAAEKEGTTTRLPIRLNCAEVPFEETIDNTGDGISVDTRAQGVKAATKDRSKEDEGDDSDVESDIDSDLDSEGDEVDSDEDLDDEDDEEGSFIEFGY